MLGERDRKLESLGYPLDRIPKAGGIYKPVVVDGTTVYTSGAVPLDGDVLAFKGKVPSQVSVDDAKRAAALCAANVLRNVRLHVGSLDRIDRVIRTAGYVNADPDFADHPQVLNGASELLRAVFGEDGVGTRTAIGTGSLPRGCTVEVDIVLRLKPEWAGQFR
jgi:enamine deaminase RidA (YjgF/YER057c/UK114 family)